MNYNRFISYKRKNKFSFDYKTSRTSFYSNQNGDRVIRIERTEL